MLHNLLSPSYSPSITRLKSSFTDQVDQHEKSAAVLPRHKGEAPHIADADGAPGAHQQEAQS